MHFVEFCRFTFLEKRRMCLPKYKVWLIKRHTFSVSFHLFDFPSFCFFYEEQQNSKLLFVLSHQHVERLEAARGNWQLWGLEISRLFASISFPVSKNSTWKSIIGSIFHFPLTNFGRWSTRWLINLIILNDNSSFSCGFSPRLSSVYFNYMCMKTHCERHLFCIWSCGSFFLYIILFHSVHSPA